MLSFKELSEKKKTNVLINPKKKDLQEKNHGEDCDCMKCEEKRRKEDVNDGPDIATEESCGKGMYYCNTDKKCKPIPEGYKEDKDGMLVKEAKYEAGASNYGKMSIRNKRAVGYGGNAAPPEERRKAHAERMKKHKGVTEATRYAKETGKSFKSGKPVVKGGTAKDDKAFQAVAKKYSGQMMGGQQQKKVRGQKPDESNTPFKRAAERMKKIKMDNKALADKAKKAGYKSTQDYVNVQAVRKGGLGT